MSVSQAGIKNAVPAMAAMLMTMIYNIADIFFIGRTHDAYQVAAVSLASPVFLIFMSVGMVFMNSILTFVGASADTWDFAKDYLTIVSCGGVFVLVSNCFSNILRAEGQATKAIFGQILGNLLNVVFDPIMILVFGWDIKGAAIIGILYRRQKMGSL